MQLQPAGLAETPLFLWLSPAFPVGGFAYSHGLEAAVDAGAIRDAASLSDWLIDLATHGSIRQDAILLAAAWKAVRAGPQAALSEATLAEVNDLALALCVGRERRLETSAMGKAFVNIIRATWPGALPSGLDDDTAYPVALGAASAAQNIDLLPTVELFGMAFVANLVSAAVRLGPIGQTDGQRVTAAMLPVIRELAAIAARSMLEDLGGCAFRSDLAAIQHETQYSRLFRS